MDTIAINVRDVVRSSGVPLAPDVRALMEACFARDLSRVRIHADRTADTSARALNAWAYTIGSHIVFRKGRYSPGTPEGLWLLAHELAHVVQQDGEPTMAALSVGDADHPLEHEAHWAADLIAGGHSLPTGFTFWAAPAGIIQCHTDASCPGTRINPQDRGIGGNWAIEIAYKEENQSHENAIFFGSQYENVDVLLPKGAPNKKFGNMLLSRLRGLQNQRRPDIIDFHNRVFYEIKTPEFVNEGMVQIESYYKIAKTVLREYARFDEPEWKRSDATWYPPHVLAYPSDPRNIVCTQATDHRAYPGLILYDVRRLSRKEDKERRESRRVTSYRLWEFDRAFNPFYSTMVSELHKKIRLYDPSNPDYVIIAPKDIHRALWQQENEKIWEKMRVKPSYDFPGGHDVEKIRRLLLIVTGVIAIVGVFLVLAVGGALILSIPASAAAAGAGTAATGGGATITSLAAYRAAVLAAPRVKDLGRAAGILIVFGSVIDAQAANPAIGNVSAIRAVSLGDFEPVRGQGIQSATSLDSEQNVLSIQSCRTFTKDFSVGKEVLFDGQPYVIIGQFSAK